MGLMKQTDFARRHNVSRKTVTEWKKGGYLVMQGNFVDADASDMRLRGRRRGRFGEGGTVTQAVTPTVTPTVTQSASAGQGNSRGNSRGNKQGNAGYDASAKGVAGFTPEAEALLAVLHLEGPGLFDRFLAAYGVPLAERMKACEGFAMTLGYIGQGLYVGAGADLHAWAFDVRHPDFSDARQVVDVVDAEMESINAEMQDRENDPESTPYAAIQAGRRARVVHSH